MAFLRPVCLGRYTFSFNKPGTVHFASGCVLHNCQVFMRGTINVVEATSITTTLSVKTNSVEATYVVSILFHLQNLFINLVYNLVVNFSCS